MVGDVAPRRGDRRRRRRSSVRLACAPALGVAWWWTHLVAARSSRARRRARSRGRAAAPGSRGPRRRALGRAHVRDAVRALDVRARGVRCAARRSRPTRCAARSASGCPSVSTSNGRSTPTRTLRTSTAATRTLRRLRAVRPRARRGAARAIAMRARRGGPAVAHVGNAELRPAGRRGLGRAAPALDVSFDDGATIASTGTVALRRPLRARSRGFAPRRTAAPTACPSRRGTWSNDRIEIEAEVLGLVTVPDRRRERWRPRCSRVVCAATRSTAGPPSAGRAGSTRLTEAPPDWTSALGRAAWRDGSPNERARRRARAHRHGSRDVARARRHAAPVVRPQRVDADGAGHGADVRRARGRARRRNRHVGEGAHPGRGVGGRVRGGRRGRRPRDGVQPGRAPAQPAGRAGGPARRGARHAGRPRVRRRAHRRGSRPRSPTRRSVAD